MSEQKEIGFIEMFCGVGGVRLGLEKTSSKNNVKSHKSKHQTKNARSKRNLDIRRNRPQTGYRCVWANDWEYADFKWKKNRENGELEWKGTKNKCGEVYTKHWNDGTYIDQDIKTISADSIPDHTLLTAGFPCQAFSFAGERKGFQDTRGTLFYDIARVAEAKRPPLLLLENVKGLLSHDKGLTFQVIIESLEELGYLVEWQVLNSKHFGVPQNRERVFIVGHLRGAGSRQIFPIREVAEDFVKSPSEAQGERSRFRTANSLGIGGSFKERNLIANTLKSRYYKDGSENLIADFNQNGSIYYKNISSALRSPKASQSNLLLGTRIRRLTPTECERLQGFPDGWTEGVSDTQRYKLLGNAVTVNVIEYLGKMLRECLP